MVTRIAVLNNEIYRISEAKYREIMFQEKKELIICSRKEVIKVHNRNCEIIKKHGKKILDADIMFRND